MRRLGLLVTIGAGLFVWTAATRGAGAFAGEGTVSGKVKLVGKAPPNPIIDMSDEAKCAAKYPTPPREPVVDVSPTGMLGNVFVYVKSGLPAGAKYPVPSSPSPSTRTDASTTPGCSASWWGRRSRSKTAMACCTTSRRWARRTGPSISASLTFMSTDRSFTTDEVMLPFECNVHGWMHAFAGVLPYPFFATSAGPTANSRSRGCLRGPTYSRRGTRSTGRRTRRSR